MPTTRITGDFYEREDKRTQTPIVDRNIFIGAYRKGAPSDTFKRKDEKGANDELLRGTRVRLWVPQPTQPDHIPGVFVAMSNPRGRVFTRSSPNEIQAFAAWLLGLSSTLEPAYQQATQIVDLLKDYDRQLMEDDRFTELRGGIPNAEE